MNSVSHSIYFNRLRNGLLMSALVFGLLNCGKSNYLTVNEEAIIQDKQGVFIRSGPTTKDKKVTLVPYGQTFKVLSEGAKESMYGISSRWYKVVYRGKSGWLWGGLAAPVGKAAEPIQVVGKCQSLTDYAKKNYKQLSEKDTVLPGEVNEFMDRRIKIKTIEFEKGIVAEERFGYESFSETLKIPGATVDDGVNILNACVRQAIGCSTASAADFKRAAYNIQKLPDGCRPSGFDFRETGLRFAGKILILDVSDHE